MTYSENETKVMYCYRERCGITALYPGYCGCPNRCYEKLGQGRCIEGKECACKLGHSGLDCSQIDCSLPSVCGEHGKCKSDKKHATDYCECDDGWTSVDCSVKTNKLSVLPYGEIFEGRPYYTKEDKYHDEHPVFNLSVIANIHLKLGEKDLEYLLSPCNAFNQSAVLGTFFFDNGNVIERIDDVGIELKGRHTRTMLKKSWKIKFAHFVKGTKFVGLKKLSIKYPFPDTTSMKGQLTGEFLRAMMVPVTRSSYAALWINGIYWGLYWIHEEHDKDFLAARYTDPGNLYKCRAEAFLQYAGDDAEVYQNMTYEAFQFAHHKYKQAEGNGKWSDFVKLVKALNTSMKHIEDELSVKRYLRELVVEVFTDNTDGYAKRGNNFGLIFNENSDQFEFMSYDNDYTMNNFAADIFGNFSNPKAALTRKIMADTDRVKEYSEYMLKFLHDVCDDHLCPKVVERILTLQEFLFKIVEKDFFFRLDYNRNMKDYKTEVGRVMQYLPMRVDYIKSILQKSQSDSPSVNLV